MELPEELKKGVRSNFLFSKKTGARVSRAIFPNLWKAEAIVEKLGLEDGGKVGENLIFAEQMERKAERAERYEHKAGMAVQKGEALQQPIKDMHGDIAFFTQPNINSSSGRAFTRRREKMFAAWEKGFEEFMKSKYYEERAETAEQIIENAISKSIYYHECLEAVGGVAFS